MKNKLYLSLLGLFVLTACNDKNENTNNVNSADNAQVASAEKKQELTQEQVFLKMQIKQKENAKEIQSYLDELQKGIDSEEKAKQAQKDAEAKFNSLNEETQKYYDSLNITDSDVKDYLKLQDDALKVQKDLGAESANLAKLSKNGTEKLTQEQMKKYVELNKKMADVSSDVIAKKIAIDEKFANSATGAVKEYYQISSILDLEYKNAGNIAKKLADDKSIQSQEAYNEKLLAEVLKIDEEIVKKLNALEVSDADVKAYKDSVANMMQKKIDVSKKAPDMKKEYTKDNKLSVANEALMKELNQANQAADQQLDKVLNKLTQ
ncbi:MAG: hypothetical protein N4Q32_01645 [Neisseriaceae bacterium]|nr:hypothetical protein [Neisseriaceae bacterium PsAf]MCV2502962.1 hypothetical protein [Neisseriaceae bacterium]MCV2509124.1 hypothetical protein [Neisseriaceae bacterium]